MSAECRCLVITLPVALLATGPQCTGTSHTFWPENGNCIIFDESNAVLDEIYTFVEEALDAGDSVLIHSVEGDSRACFCASVYFMPQVPLVRVPLLAPWSWRSFTPAPPLLSFLGFVSGCCRTLSKTLAYMRSKRNDLNPKPGFMRQLYALDQVRCRSRFLHSGFRGPLTASLLPPLHSVAAPLRVCNASP